jgi:hypothetical protein
VVRDGTIEANGRGNNISRRVSEFRNAIFRFQRIPGLCKAAFAELGRVQKT